MRIVHLFNPSNFLDAVKEAQDFTSHTGVEAMVVTIIDYKDAELVSTYVECSDHDLKPVVMTHYNLSNMKTYGVSLPDRNLNT